ncbi:hypothetical protein HZB58_05990 [Candidatus Gottesmanbacteria bacterium]|nr:hypothetical protein [Candidatus Gottesmanbacteria bacterium]
MMPWYLGNPQGDLPHVWRVGLEILTVWSLVWAGLSLWHAARRNDRGWFIFFLFVHTAGLVEFVYLMFVAKVFTTSSKRSLRRRK